jgi:hypothetical protein
MSGVMPKTKKTAISALLFFEKLFFCASNSQTVVFPDLQVETLYSLFLCPSVGGQKLSFSSTAQQENITTKARHPD